MSVVYYVEGNSFPNIFGGHTDCQFASIAVRDGSLPKIWEHLRGRYDVHDGRTTLFWSFDLEEVKQFCIEKWPHCYFKSPEDYRREAGM